MSLRGVAGVGPYGIVGLLCVGGVLGEANLSTKEEAASPRAWVSGPHAYAGRAPYAQAASGQGEASADRLRLGPDGARVCARPARAGRRVRRVYRQGSRRSTALLDLHHRPNGLGIVRLGLVVGRRFGRATQRNRLRRQLREAVRAQREHITTDADLVVVPRETAARAAYSDLRTALAAALGAAGLLTRDRGATEGDEANTPIAHCRVQTVCLSTPPAGLPLLSVLLRVRRRGDRTPWPDARGDPDGAPHRTLSPVPPRRL